MENSVHASAVIDPAATIGKNVKIGPFCVIGAGVVIGDHCDIKSHAVIEGDTHIGAGCVIFPFAAIGMDNQDLKHKGGTTKIRIGENNKIREHVTIHPGTVQDKGVTTIGDNNLLMIGVHIAHDCVVGNHNVLANNATLAGHVKIGNYCILGGLSAYHQFVQVGDYAIVGGMSPVEHDVIPYGLVKGERARLAGLNHIGLDRRGFEKDDVKALMKAYKAIFGPSDDTFKDRVEAAASEYQDNDVVSKMIDFIMSERKQPLCQTK